jgi:hypothetical protein
MSSGNFGQVAILVEYYYRRRRWFIGAERISRGYGNRIGIECSEGNGIGFTGEVLAVEVIAIGSIYDAKA